MSSPDNEYVNREYRGETAPKPDPVKEPGTPMAWVLTFSMGLCFLAFVAMMIWWFGWLDTPNVGNS
ncbi:MAG: hypothetical protein AAGJ53_06380 [Pseudomonadota bacterium]